MHNPGQQHSDFTITELSTKASEMCVCSNKQFFFLLLLLIVNSVRDTNILNQAGDDLMHLDLIE